MADLVVLGGINMDLACGAPAVTRHGAQPSLPHAPAVDRLLKGD
jgi:hypothetical protein